MQNVVHVLAHVLAHVFATWWPGLAGVFIWLMLCGWARWWAGLGGGLGLVPRNLGGGGCLHSGGVIANEQPMNNLWARAGAR